MIEHAELRELFRADPALRARFKRYVSQRAKRAHRREELRETGRYGNEVRYGKLQE